MIRSSCTVREEDLEDAYDVLLPVLPQGVHERPAPGGRVELSWFGHGRVELGGLARDWREEAAAADRRRYGHVWVLGGRVAVRAPGTPAVAAGLLDVVIDADRGQFGTGAHPTTRDCLELLLAVPPEGSFADLGCGAGVLAVVAAKLGFAPVHAVDREPGSVRMTQENARRNGVAIDAAPLDLLADAPPAAETVAANVPLAVHERLAARMRPRRLIVSGVVTPEADRILDLYAGYRPVRRTDDAGWTSALLERE